MSAIENLKIVIQPYLTAKDIAALFGCGLTVASNIKKAIEVENEESDAPIMTPYKKCVPTSLFLRKYNLSIAYFAEMAELELNLIDDKRLTTTKFNTTEVRKCKHFMV